MYYFSSEKNMNIVVCWLFRNWRNSIFVKYDHILIKLNRVSHNITKAYNRCLHSVYIVFEDFCSSISIKFNENINFVYQIVKCYRKLRFTAVCLRHNTILKMKINTRDKHIMRHKVCLHVIACFNIEIKRFKVMEKRFFTSIFSCVKKLLFF